MLNMNLSDRTEEMIDENSKKFVKTSVNLLVWKVQSGVFSFEY